MQISFHTDPVCIGAICAELVQYGVVVIETTRPNFKVIADQVQAAGTAALPLATSVQNGDFYYFLLHVAEDYECVKTEADVTMAIHAWHQAGRHYPHVEQVGFNITR